MKPLQLAFASLLLVACSQNEQEYGFLEAKSSHQPEHSHESLAKDRTNQKTGSAWERLPAPCRSFLAENGVSKEFWTEGDRGDQTKAFASFLESQSGEWRPKSYAITIHNGLWRDIGSPGGSKAENGNFYRSVTLFQGLSLCDVIRDKGNPTLAKQIEDDLWEYDLKKMWRAGSRIGR